MGLQRELLQAATQLRLAQAEFDRNEQLRKTKTVSERIYLESRSALDEAAALVDERRQVLQLAGMTPEAVADLEQARRMSSTLEVRSPIDGVVVEVPAVLGERVDDSEPLYRVARLEPLWLEISAPLDRLQGVQPGGLVEIPCDAGEARVDLIGRNVDPANQTVLVRAEVKGAGYLPAPRPVRRGAAAAQQHRGAVPRALQRHHAHRRYADGLRPRGRRFRTGQRKDHRPRRPIQHRRRGTRRWLEGGRKRHRLPQGRLDRP